MRCSYGTIFSKYRVNVDSEITITSERGAHFDMMLPIQWLCLIQLYRLLLNQMQPISLSLNNLLTIYVSVRNYPII